MGLYFACQGGNMDIVNMMIQKGANDWNWGLWQACKDGHLDFVNTLIQKGADDSKRSR